MTRRKGDRWRGTVSVQMTADELLSAAVNSGQNHWAMGSSVSRPAIEAMLRQVYELVLETNRLAVASPPKSRATPRAKKHHLKNTGFAVNSDLSASVDCRPASRFQWWDQSPTRVL